MKNLRSKIIITISNKTFNIIRKIELLINATNNFILFHYFEMFYIKKIVNKNEYIKMQIIIIKNKKFIFLKINIYIYFFNLIKKTLFNLRTFIYKILKIFKIYLSF